MDDKFVRKYYSKDIISTDDLSQLLYDNADDLGILFSKLTKFSVIVDNTESFTYIIRTQKEVSNFYNISLPSDSTIEIINKFKPGDYVRLKGDNKSILVVTDYPIYSDNYRDRLVSNIKKYTIESSLFNDDLLMIPCYGTVNGVLTGCNCDGFVTSDFHYDKLEHIEYNSFPWLNPVANCIFRATMDYEDNNFDEKFDPTKFVAKLIEHEDEIDFWCYDKKSNNFVRELYEQFIKDIENEE